MNLWKVNKVSIGQAIDKMVEDMSAKVPTTENEYLGEDGLLYCSVCHAKTETIVRNPFTLNETKVRCICKCREKELEEQKRREKQQKHERMRLVCFAETNMKNYTFANDDRNNPKISDAMIRYVENFEEFKKEGKGILFHGNVGTGKTFLSACIANALIDKDYDVLMTNFSSIINTIQGMFDGKQAYINSLNRYSLLIIDDLGTERSSEYVQEQVYNIVDARYRSGLPFIVTTNLTMDEIKNNHEIGYSRIYDRILERCHPVKVDGTSRRKQNIKNTYFDVKERLGL